jgi:hypothetical protein
METNELILLIQSLTWPVVVLITLIVLRKPLAVALETVARRAGKLDLRVLSIELTPEIDPDWRVDFAGGRIDLRNLTSDQVFDSYSYTLFEQIGRGTQTDVAVMDLGAGHEWLTSRLYLFAMLLERLRGVRCLVFVRTRENRHRQVIGVAAPNHVRDALAAEEPWLESTYLAAWNAVCGATARTADVPISSAHWDDLVLQSARLDAGTARSVAQNFIRLIQTSTKPRTNQHEWQEFVVTDPPNNARMVWEHTRWIDPADPPGSLGQVIDERSVMATDPTDAPADQKKTVLLQEGEFTTLVEKDGTLRGVVDRPAMLDQAVRTVLHTS